MYLVFQYKYLNILLSEYCGKNHFSANQENLTNKCNKSSRKESYL